VNCPFSRHSPASVCSFARAPPHPTLLLVQIAMQLAVIHLLVCVDCVSPFASVHVALKPMLAGLLLVACSCCAQCCSHIDKRKTITTRGNTQPRSRRWMCCGPRAIDVQSESTSQICALRVSRAAQRVHVWMRGTQAHPRKQNIFQKFLLRNVPCHRRTTGAMSSTPPMLATSTRSAGAVCSVHRVTRTRAACTPRCTRHARLEQTGPERADVAFLQHEAVGRRRTSWVYAQPYYAQPCLRHQPRCRVFHVCATPPIYSAPCDEILRRSH
jgi:hypothetical protein